MSKNSTTATSATRRAMMRRLLAIGVAVSAAGAAGGPQSAPRAPSGAAPGGPVAMLPVENLSDAPAPLAQVHQALRARLLDRGVPLVDDGELEAFMRRHRLRHVGGLSRETGRALRSETGAGSALVTSLDLYSDADPPRFALTARLVASGDDVRILWMDSAAMAGDEAPGFLGLGRVGAADEARDLILERIAASLARHLGAPGARRGQGPGAGRPPGRLGPKSFYRSPAWSPAGPGPVTIAVMPFANESATRRAGEILTLQIVRALASAPGVEVVEPGVVRHELLQARLIQQEGLSVPQSDLLKALLDVDLVLFGAVTEYLEGGAAGADPVIDFSARAFDTGRRQVIWSSISHGRGNEGVFFFGLGRIATAHRLAAGMARALVSTFLPAAEGAS